MEQRRLTSLFDAVAPVYDTVEPRFFRDIARGLVARLAFRRWSRVLDVATGPGVVLSEIAGTAAGAARLVGVDSSPGMVREARARLDGVGAPAHVVVMDAGHLAFVDGSFDLVTMSRACLLPQRGAILREIHRVLEPDGLVAVAEFGRLDPRWSWKDDLYARLLPAVPGSARPAFDAAILHRDLEAVGFEDVQVEADDLDVAFASLDEWWESSMSHGERGALGQMDGDARRAFFELADPSRCVEEDGRLHWRPEVLFGIARR